MQFRFFSCEEWVWVGHVAYPPLLAFLAPIDVVDTEEGVTTLAFSFPFGESFFAVGACFGFQPEDSSNRGTGGVVGWEPLTTPQSGVAEGVGSILGEEPCGGLVKLHANIVHTPLDKNWSLLGKGFTIGAIF